MFKVLWKYHNSKKEQIPKKMGENVYPSITEISPHNHSHTLSYIFFMVSSLLGQDQIGLTLAFIFFFSWRGRISDCRCQVKKKGNTCLFIPVAEVEIQTMKGLAKRRCSGLVAIFSKASCEEFWTDINGLYTKVIRSKTDRRYSKLEKMWIKFLVEVCLYISIQHTYASSN